MIYTMMAKIQTSYIEMSVVTYNVHFYIHYIHQSATLVCINHIPSLVLCILMSSSMYWITNPGPVARGRLILPRDEKRAYADRKLKEGIRITILPNKRGHFDFRSITTRLNLRFISAPDIASPSTTTLNPLTLPLSNSIVFVSVPSVALIV
jgi:hypothetical protein